MIAAQESLVTLNVSVATVIARRWSRRYPHLADDLRGSALLGLCRAALAFDPDRGTPFPHFARRVCVGEIQHFLRDTAFTFPQQRQTRAHPYVYSLDAAEDVDHDLPWWGAAQRLLTCLAVPDATEDVNLWDAVSRLPRSEQDALVACDVLGYSEQDASGRLRCAQNTVSRRRRGAHARLRVALA